MELVEVNYRVSSQTKYLKGSERRELVLEHPKGENTQDTTHWSSMPWSITLCGKSENLPKLGDTIKLTLSTSE